MIPGHFICEIVQYLSRLLVHRSFCFIGLQDLKLVEDFLVVSSQCCDKLLEVLIRHLVYFAYLLIENELIAGLTELGIVRLEEINESGLAAINDVFVFYFCVGFEKNVRLSADFLFGPFSG